MIRIDRRNGREARGNEEIERIEKDKHKRELRSQLEEEGALK